MIQSYIFFVVGISTKRSICMYCVQFNDGEPCDAWMPFGVRVTYKTAVEDSDLVLSKRKCTGLLLHEFHRRNLKLGHCIVDGPERSAQKGVIGQNGAHGCHTCTEKASSLKTNKGGQKTVYQPKRLKKTKKIKRSKYRLHDVTVAVKRNRISGRKPATSQAYHERVKGNFFR